MDSKVEIICILGISFTQEIFLLGTTSTCVEDTRTLMRTEVYMEAWLENDKIAIAIILLNQRAFLIDMITQASCNFKAASATFQLCR